MSNRLQCQWDCRTSARRTPLFSTRHCQKKFLDSADSPRSPWAGSGRTGRRPAGRKRPSAARDAVDGDRDGDGERKTVGEGVPSAARAERHAKRRSAARHAARAHTHARMRTRTRTASGRAGKNTRARTRAMLARAHTNTGHARARARTHARPPARKRPQARTRTPGRRRSAHLARVEAVGRPTVLIVRLTGRHKSLGLGETPGPGRTRSSGSVGSVNGNSGPCSVN